MTNDQELREQVAAIVRDAAGDIYWYYETNESFDFGALASEIIALVRADAFEQAARVVEKRAEKRFAEHGTLEWDTNACYYDGRRGETLEELDEEDEAIAAAIRALAKLKGSQDGR